MSKEKGSETIEALSSATDQQQVSLEIDDASAATTYSSTVRVSGTAEEINLDFAGALRPTGPKSAKLKIDHRIILNPWAAKRLAIALGQAIARYEQTYGTLELDVRKRIRGTPGTPGVSATPGAPTGQPASA